MLVLLLQYGECSLTRIAGALDGKSRTLPLPAGSDSLSVPRAYCTTSDEQFRPKPRHAAHHDAVFAFPDVLVWFGDLQAHSDDLPMKTIEDGSF